MPAVGVHGQWGRRWLRPHGARRPRREREPVNVPLRRPSVDAIAVLLETTTEMAGKSERWQTVIVDIERIFATPKTAAEAERGAPPRARRSTSRTSSCPRAVRSKIERTVLPSRDLGRLDEAVTQEAAAGDDQSRGSGTRRRCGESPGRVGPISEMYRINCPDGDDVLGSESRFRGVKADDGRVPRTVGASIRRDHQRACALRPAPECLIRWKRSGRSWAAWQITSGTSCRRCWGLDRGRRYWSGSMPRRARTPWSGWSRRSDEGARSIHERNDLCPQTQKKKSCSSRGASTSRSASRRGSFKTLMGGLVPSRDSRWTVPWGVVMGDGLSTR